MPVLCYRPDKHQTLLLTCRYLFFVGEITEYCIKELVWFFYWSECCVPECSFSSSKITILFSVPVYFVFGFVVFYISSYSLLQRHDMACLFLFFQEKISPFRKGKLLENFYFWKGKGIPVWITAAVKLLLSLIILESWSYSDFDQEHLELVSGLGQT